ncbi:hypothetical protein SODALDRAFT_358510 [Sodiomyces alkalinus F11]|uniref:Uncharacterized protein n=1 Tax=Sodiomyces alkalinus (strain CBS 110278 / VKM F-3762 / F11) TaxID=1314773 RepID=A0A3N2Q0D5_SODAK|nr:hypothetical protein SODALDRAFT_358510 [Sodiomyces alkalinus F11]ROT40075.1 hypothetical protein SODALDRAFT_358510 [Sodiomyces alkalinus F11]
MDHISTRALSVVGSLFLFYLTHSTRRYRAWLLLHISGWQGQRLASSKPVSTVVPIGPPTSWYSIRNYHSSRFSHMSRPLPTGFIKHTSMSPSMSPPYPCLLLLPRVRHHFDVYKPASQSRTRRLRAGLVHLGCLVSHLGWRVCP